MKDGHTHYTPAAGIPELRAAVAPLLSEDLRPALTPEQVIVSNGAKHSIHNALAAIVGPATRSSSPRPTGSATATWCR